MLEMYKNELESKGAFTKELPNIIKTLNNVIPNDRMPERMKAVISVSELVTFASQFRRNMWHWDGFELPINSISFLVAGSGTGKDSGVKAVRRAFAPAYDMIDDKRKELAKQNAIALAREAGIENPTDYEDYKDFYKPPVPVYIAPTTPEGMIEHINRITEHPVGAGSMYSGEIGDQLATSGNIDKIIESISEIYDTGDKEVIFTKGAQYRSKEIVSTPFSALFAGSPDYILYDAAVKRKFIFAFGSKLARRSFFAYIHELLPKPQFSSPKESVNHKRKLVDAANKIREQVAEESKKLAEYHLSKGNTCLSIDDEVFYLFDSYLNYNEEYANTMDRQYRLSILVREHLQWKALKLAGALAMFRYHDTVTGKDYIDAIRICEILDKDMARFEADLMKEAYETFSDHIRSLAKDGKAFLNLHTLRKSKYITTSGNPTQKMKELASLAASYDTEGIYTASAKGITYEKIQPVDTIRISYKPIDNSAIYKIIENGGSHKDLQNAKAAIAKTISNGLTNDETTFDQLIKLLKGDYAYSPFQFKNGERSKENLIPGTKWLVLDIDDSTITMEEAHFLLQDINHYVTTSSNKDNMFKFRVIVELDSAVDVDPITWKHFYKSIADDLALKVDEVPQSQIFYSYSKGVILSTLDKEPIKVRDHLMYAINLATEKPKIEKPLSTSEKRAALADPYVTFNYAYECPNDGTGSRKLIRAAKHAYGQLGLTKEETIDLIRDINNYWVMPMPEERLENTILSQILRFTRDTVT